MNLFVHSTLKQSGLTIVILIICGALLPSCNNQDQPDKSSDKEAQLTQREGSISFSPLNFVPKEETDQLFTSITPDISGVDFQIQLGNFASRAKEYMFASPLGGVATGDYDGNGLPDLYLTSPSGSNRLYRNKGNFQFEDVTKQTNLFDPNFWGTGAGFVDIDGDGDLDLYACGYLNPNRLYINTGNGRFTENAKSLGLNFNGASMNLNFADIDGDRDLDAYLATTTRLPPPGTKFGVKYVKQPDGSEMPVIPNEISEYWQFIYLPNKKIHRTEAGQADLIYRNDAGFFTNTTKTSGTKGNYFSLSATWWDYDLDGDPDIYVSNDFTGPDMLYRNNGDGTFNDTVQRTLPHTPWFSMGSDTGDINNDGTIDLFATDMAATSHYREKVMMGNMDNMGWFLEFAEPRQYMRNAIYLNTGTEKMLEAAYLMGIASTDWSWSPRLEDFDGDSKLDLFITNGVLRDSMHSDISAMADKKFRGGSEDWVKFWSNQPMRKEKNLAYRNIGDLQLIPCAKEWGLDHAGVSFGTATADFDGDGDPDIVVNNADGPASIYRNNSNANRITISLKGAGKNSYGIGTKVKVIVGNTVQVKEMNPVRGWLSSNEPIIYFGIGDSTQIDKLTVQWRSGSLQSFQSIKANQKLVITEPVNSIKKELPSQIPLFKSIETHSQITHTESSFDDFSLQPLLPNRQSTRGPAMQWADFDGDGDPDLFLGGSAGNSAQLFRNENGQLVPLISPALAQSAASEDVYALWIDVDSDKDVDLFVASGSNEFPPGDKRYCDRLYLNDGSGNLALDPRFESPPHPSNALTAVDVNTDGALDLITTGSAMAGEYPLSHKSYLMLNDGSGIFHSVNQPALSSALLANDLLSADIDNDGKKELVVACEWGPVRIFRIKNGSLEEKTSDWKIQNHLGWWNSLAAGDLDNDGDVDLVATNFGLNTKYKASSERPELLYYTDFDNSGTPHIVEAKFEGEICVPRRGFSCSQLAMPFLRDKLQTFHNFASSNLEGLYTRPLLEKANKFKVTTLEHCVFINRGDHFDIAPLPRASQIAPSFDAAISDLDNDGILDITLAHNFFSPQRETGRMDGGLCLILKGTGNCNFIPFSHSFTGISIQGDTRCVETVDLDGDGFDEITFAQNNGPLLIFTRNQSGDSHNP